MKVLFLIGNGFDLHMGLQTSFKDVLSSYLRTDDQNDDIAEFKDHIKANIETWADFEKQIGTYAGEFDHGDGAINCLHFVQNISHFQRFLNTYLQEEENKVTYKNNGQIEEAFIDSIYRFPAFLKAGPRSKIEQLFSNRVVYNFVNFNYTTIFTKN